MAKRDLSLPNQCLPVKFTSDTEIYNYKGPIVLGAHYPVTQLRDGDGYGDIVDPICEGPLCIEFTIQEGVLRRSEAICSKCGLSINPEKPAYEHKRDFFAATDRWLIDSATHRFESEITSPRVSLTINRELHPGQSALIFSSILIGLIRSDETYKHSVLAYARVTKELLRITKIQSDNVKTLLGYK